MCVTAYPAVMTSTMAYTYANYHRFDSRTTHVTGYQNSGVNIGDMPNCMLLHFPGHNLEMVDGPQHTFGMMHDIVRDLPQLEPIPQMRGTSRFTAPGVMPYGDYHVVLAQRPLAILEVLDQVPADRRPIVNHEFMALVDWYQSHFPGFTFVLACFNGTVVPKHPIVVEYIPFNDDVLFVPGIDAHDGQLPIVGDLIPRDFRIAICNETVEQPFKVNYADPSIAGAPWAPSNVTGFWDNRTRGPNLDYVFSLQDTDFGLAGHDLLAELIS